MAMASGEQGACSLASSVRARPGRQPAHALGRRAGACCTPAPLPATAQPHLPAPAAPGAQVGPDSVLEDKASVKRSVVGSGCVLGTGTKVGRAAGRLFARAGSAGCRGLRPLSAPGRGPAPSCCRRLGARCSDPGSRCSRIPRSARPHCPALQLPHHPPACRSSTACSVTTCALARTATSKTASSAAAAAWATACACATASWRLGTRCLQGRSSAKRCCPRRPTGNDSSGTSGRPAGCDPILLLRFSRSGFVIRADIRVASGSAQRMASRHE